jgi:hypothetical protein
MSVGIGKGVDRYGAVAEQLSNPAVKMNQLIQYARGTNPLVPSFMALAEIQNRQNAVALQPGQFSPTTVAQDLITKAEAPQMPMNMPGMASQQVPQGVAALQAPQGVAALPSGMGQQSFAGGGIVAFAGDTDGSDVKDPYAALSFADKLQNLRAAEEQDTDLSKNVMFRRNMPSIGSFSKNLTALDPVQASRVYGRTQDQEDREGPAAVPPGMDPTKQIAPPTDKGPSAGPKILSKAASDTTKESGITQTTPKESMYDKYEKMLMEQSAESKAARQQDKYMRLLEAGLGIIGGTSPYAAVNIGQGATQAVRGYAQDKAAAQKEERQNVVDLMNLGMKKEEAEREAQKLAMTEKLYGSHGRYYDAAAAAAGVKAATAGTAADTRLTIAQQNLVHKYFQDLKKDMSNYGVSDDVLMQKAMGMAGVQGGPNVLAAPTTIQFNSLSAPKKS